MAKYIWVGITAAILVSLPTASWAKKPKKKSVLNFEADVIEGEVKVPNIFLQLGVETPKLEAVMYFRNDFNEYHRVERKRKPFYRNQSINRGAK